MKSLRLLVLSGLALQSVLAQRVGDPTQDLDKLSVEELFSIQVTSVGRKAEKLSKASAAVFVLTGEDIRRSGATCIPEALQWVPGLTVLRVDGRSWVVSARGGARLYADKMLVMIDGRSLYTPLFSGVMWDSIGVPMGDIEQIEVVRGPGAVMWGPNAVNGVINIITKSAHHTKGAVISASAGNELRGATDARWGGSLGDKLSYRVWEKIEDVSPGFNSTGYFRFANQYFMAAPVGNLDSVGGRAGFRFDGQPTDRDQWMVQGDAFGISRHDSDAFPVIMPFQADLVNGHTGYQGGFLQGRWVRNSASDKESVLQFSFTRTALNYPFISGNVNNFTLDYQKRWKTSDRNEFYWGVGYQEYWDDADTRRFLDFSPTDANYLDGDVVVRDEFQLIPGVFMASAGVRIDYSSYHQWQYQPSLRLLYTPNSSQSFWAGVSRAVRAPGRFDRDIRYDFGSIMLQGIPLPVAIPASGSKAAKSEVERSLEAGYRLQAGQRWSLDASVYWSYYTRLRLFEASLYPQLSFAGPVPQLTLPGIATNAGTGRTYGAEISSIWQVSPGWRLVPSYSYLNETNWVPSQTYFRYQWDGTPSTLPHQAALRSQHNLARNIKLDLMAKVRSRDQNLNLPGIFVLDARIAWKATRTGELSFSVQDLANRHAIECYSEGPTIAVPLRRTFYFNWTQRL